MIDASRYSISVRKAAIDGETLFEAKVRELPDVAGYGESFDEAYGVAIDSIESLAAAAQSEGLPFPEPLQEEETASGRVTLRLPKSMHARVAEDARREDISLNTYLVSLISHGLGVAETSQGKWTYASRARYQLTSEYNAAIDIVVLDTLSDQLGAREKLKLVGPGRIASKGVAGEVVVKDWDVRPELVYWPPMRAAHHG